MFFQVSNALKKRFVIIFQDILDKHAQFRDFVTVDTKFKEEERDKYQVILRGFTGQSQKLSLDNFGATARSYSALANLKGVFGASIEWVIDDTLNNADKMSPPGYYVVSVISEDTVNKTWEFIVSPFYKVIGELIDPEAIIGGFPSSQLDNQPVNPGSEAVFDEVQGLELKRDIEYTIDYETGIIKFIGDISEYGTLKVDYQVIGEEMGPFQIERYMGTNEAIPGVVLAFGDRIQKGDEQVVALEATVRETAKIYTGRWQTSIDVMVVGQEKPVIQIK